VKINDRMFKYDANKQAYIADPDARTHRELVEAAESCQVSIIHSRQAAQPAGAGARRAPEARGAVSLIGRALVEAALAANAELQRKYLGV
jgi:hypothetical protein